MRGFNGVRPRFWLGMSPILRSGQVARGGDLRTIWGCRMWEDRESNDQLQVSYVNRLAY